MATVTWEHPPNEATFTLILTEEEALHVLGATGRVLTPHADVYSPLFDSLLAAGVSEEEMYEASERFEFSNS